VTGHEFHEEEALGKAYDSRLMKRLLAYLRPHRGVVALSILILIVTSLLELAGPFLTKIAIDRYIATKDLPGLLHMAALFLGTLVFALGFGYFQIYLMQRMGQEIMLTLRAQIFSHLQRLHIGYFDRNPVGRLITRLTSDVEALNEMFTSGVVAIFGDLITLLGIMGILLFLDWKLALIAFAVLPFLFALSLWFRKHVRDTYRDVRIRLARINAFLQESITGMSVLQVMNHEERSRADFQRLNRAHTEAHLRSIFYYATFYPAVEIFSALALALVIFAGGGQIMRDAFTLGGLVAFIQYVRRFYQPIQDLSEKYNILQGAMASSERIFQLLDTEPAVRDGAGAAVPPTAAAAPAPAPALETDGDADGSGDAGGEPPLIEFRNVWFAYKDADWVLRDVSFSVRRGESVAFVGATGSGKTTTMSLLMRFYDVQKGSVRVEGVDVREWDQKALRRRMSLVLQDVFLFRGSVAENIRMGDDHIPDDRVEEAARVVNAYRFVAALPQGFDTLLGERGASVSTGQKQLLSFARALAHDPEILILDEATSNVDTETEILIQDALLRLMKGRTSLVVAHRLSTVRNTDRILLLHKGMIREEGTHQELLKQRGLYYRLYLLQYQGQEAALGLAAPQGS
jgi:ATP-binding cassette subfamily B protein